MTIGQDFDCFFKAIDITPEEAARAQALQREVRAHLEKHVTGARRSFLAGSFARGTAVRPLNDVDIFLELDEDRYPGRRAAGARSLIDRFVAEVQRTYATQSAKIRPQGHSVGIQLTGAGIKLDVIPAFPKDPGESGPRTQGYEIPERDPTNQWILTFPEAHAAKCKKANEDAGGMLNRLIKAVKHWNRTHEASHSDHKPLRSFHVELMCYRAFDRKPDSFSMGLAALFRYLAAHLTDPCPPPAGKRPDVAAYLAADDNRLRWAQRQLNAAAKLADEAVAAERARIDATARAAWRSLLGAPFPA